jgi:hypothetical protein
MTFPFEKIGLGLNNKSMNFYIPRALLWIAGLSSSMHILGQMRCLKNELFIWLRSMVNANKYLNPVADKIENFRQE